MFVRFKDGRYSGEIREVLPQIGKELIAAGRAENPYADAPVVAAKIPIARATPRVASTKPVVKSANKVSR
ncbi:MAG: hypothetical protein JST28_09125 [Acidobacteria bacterium]|nr:hypothetical protein [Acidobacteriota bacterium]